jgi:hypothetical protein
LRGAKNDSYIKETTKYKTNDFEFLVAGDEIDFLKIAMGG